MTGRDPRNRDRETRCPRRTPKSSDDFSSALPVTRILQVLAASRLGEASGLQGLGDSHRQSCWPL